MSAGSNEAQTKNERATLELREKTLANKAANRLG
jgi:hypothetical protein